MFDREYAKKQIELLPDEELKRIYSLRGSDDYVPGYFELVALELKKRGVEEQREQKDGGAEGRLKDRGAETGGTERQRNGGAAKDKELKDGGAEERRNGGAEGRKEMKGEKAEGGYLHIVDEYSRMFANNEIKEKLGISNFSNEELIQMYIWESESSHLLSLIGDELKGRLIDPDKYVIPKIVNMPATEQEPNAKECPKCSVSVRTTDNYCFSCGTVLV